jgi:hypothetical protein
MRLTRSLEHDVTVSRRELLRPSLAAWQLSWSDWVLLAVLVLALGGFFALGLLAPGVLFSLALLGAVLLAIRKLIQWPSRRRQVAIAVTVLLVLAGVGMRTWLRYNIAEVMAARPASTATRSTPKTQRTGASILAGITAATSPWVKGCHPLRLYPGTAAPARRQDNHPR